MCFCRSTLRYVSRVAWTKQCHFFCSSVIGEGQREYPCIIWEVKRPHSWLSHWSVIPPLIRHTFSGKLVVKSPEPFFSFLFLSIHKINKYLAFLAISPSSLKLNYFSHFLPWLLLRECARNLAKGPLPLQVTGRALCISVLLMRAFKTQIKEASTGTI